MARDLPSRHGLRSPVSRYSSTSGYTKEILLNEGRLDAEVTLLQKLYRTRQLVETLSKLLPQSTLAETSPDLFP